MRTLIVEDDFVCRKILLAHLSKFGDCDVAIDGVEALEAFQNALDENNPYDLICLDIQMPNLDGQGALKAIRDREVKAGRVCDDAAKIIMVTSLKDNHHVFRAFRAQSDAYLVKPVSKEKLLESLVDLKLITEPV